MILFPLITGISVALVSNSFTTFHSILPGLNEIDLVLYSYASLTQIPICLSCLVTADVSPEVVDGLLQAVKTNC